MCLFCKSLKIAWKSLARIFNLHEQSNIVCFLLHPVWTEQGMMVELSNQRSKPESDADIKFSGIECLFQQLFWKDLSLLECTIAPWRKQVNLQKPVNLKLSPSQPFLSMKQEQWVLAFLFLLMSVAVTATVTLKKATRDWKVGKLKNSVLARTQWLDVFAFVWNHSHDLAG